MTAQPKRPWRLLYRRTNSKSGKWSVFSCFASKAAAKKTAQAYARDNGGRWEVKVERHSTPTPTGTEQALEEAKEHIRRLTMYWMENPGWQRDCEAAREFVAGVPTAVSHPEPGAMRREEQAPASPSHPSRSA